MQAFRAEEGSLHDTEGGNDELLLSELDNVKDLEMSSDQQHRLYILSGHSASISKKKPSVIFR